MASELGLEDRALLERVARRVVDLRLEVPAILTLESCRPLSLVAGQALLFFQPLAQALFPLPHLERFAALLERRDALDALTRLIEGGAEEARRTRAAARGARSGS
jgi:hypothetical protein